MSKIKKDERFDAKDEQKYAITRTFVKGSIKF